MDTKTWWRFAYQDDEARMNQDIHAQPPFATVDRGENHLPSPSRAATNPRHSRNKGSASSQRSPRSGRSKAIRRLRKTSPNRPRRRPVQGLSKKVDDIQMQAAESRRLGSTLSLKSAVNRDREAAGKLPEGQRQARLNTVAKQLWAHDQKRNDPTTGHRNRLRNARRHACPR